MRWELQLLIGVYIVYRVVLDTAAREPQPDPAWPIPRFLRTQRAADYLAFACLAMFVDLVVALSSSMK